LQQVASRLPVNIYRCKGVIYSAEMPERQAILQVVGKRVDISIEHEWGSRMARTQIVAFGAHGAIDGDQLRSQFECCLDEFWRCIPIYERDIVDNRQCRYRFCLKIAESLLNDAIERIEELEECEKERELLTEE
jgi:hypothetical protein